ncbi:cytochrome P450 [Gigaspora margarita]|uniref:Cytochrome P450 n=1 Tax=Gigaspora margarita TaxID=4874 RepID=A0A8H3ZZQ9_GIGMA|nr:cytochrome P450 [Gigaspora margarita]
MAIYNIISCLKITDFLIIFVFTFLVYVFRFYYKYFTRPNPLPGPLPLPFIECSYLYDGDTKNFFTLLNKKYGDLCEYYLNGKRRILISSPEYLEKILTPSSKDNTFMIRLPHSEGYEEYGMAGRGIIVNHDIKSWRYNRHFFNKAILTPSFNNEAVKWTNIMTQELEDYWKSLGNLNLSKDNLKNENDWQIEIDMAEWARRFTSDMIVILITGERSYTMASYYNLYSLVKVTRSNPLIEDSERFVKAFSDYLFGLHFFMYFGYFSRRYQPGIKDTVKYLLNNRDYVFETLDNIIKKRRKEIEEMPVGAKLGHDMLTTLIITNTERDMNQEKNITKDDISTRPMTNVEIRGNLLDAFIAGVDTMANRFSFLTYYVCHSPHVKQKMIDEIYTIFPPNTPYNLNYVDLIKLEYCDAVMNEASRIISVAVDVARYIPNSCELAGYRWEAGTTFHMNINGIHSNENYWPNPEIFDPDRFYKKNDDMNNKVGNKFSFIPFGGGLRVCPGRKLTMIELISLVVVIFGKYDIELVDMNARQKQKAVQY